MKYEFIDDVQREDINDTIESMRKKKWKFKAFLQNKNHYDEVVGILFEK